MPIAPRPPFSLVSQTPLRPGARMPAVVVCILTRQRPDGLEATLRSLAAQDGPEAFAILIVDNDPIGAEGARVGAAFLANQALPGAVVTVEQPGHCSASNGAFAAARALFPETPFVAMIDDDEEAEPDWLRHLIDAQALHGADLVGGPVMPRFERRDASRFAAHPVFTPFFARSGPVPFLYGSGNFLMRAAVLDRLGQPAFHPAFDFIGGGDFDFFLRCRDAGFTAYFSADARATETVPCTRTTVRWVLARSMRYGTINHMIESRFAGTRLKRLKVPLKSACLLGLAPLRAALRFIRSRNLLVASHPVLEAIGRVVAPFGLRPEQYRSPR